MKKKILATLLAMPLMMGVGFAAGGGGIPLLNFAAFEQVAVQNPAPILRAQVQLAAKKDPAKLFSDAFVDFVIKEVASKKTLQDAGKEFQGEDKLVLEAVWIALNPASQVNRDDAALKVAVDKCASFKDLFVAIHGVDVDGSGIEQDYQYKSGEAILNELLNTFVADQKKESLAPAMNEFWEVLLGDPRKPRGQLAAELDALKLEHGACKAELDAEKRKVDGIKGLVDKAVAAANHQAELVNGAALERQKQELVAQIAAKLQEKLDKDLKDVKDINGILAALDGIGVQAQVGQVGVPVVVKAQAPAPVRGRLQAQVYHEEQVVEGQAPVRGRLQAPVHHEEPVKAQAPVHHEEQLFKAPAPVLPPRGRLQAQVQHHEEPVEAKAQVVLRGRR